jgi:hypothetical protein
MRSIFIVYSSFSETGYTGETPMLHCSTSRFAAFLHLPGTAGVSPAFLHLPGTAGVSPAFLYLLMLSHFVVVDHLLPA